jgi:hypothetical protein
MDQHQIYPLLGMPDVGFPPVDFRGGAELFLIGALVFVFGGLIFWVARLQRRQSAQRGSARLTVMLASVIGGLLAGIGGVAVVVGVLFLVLGLIFR